VATVATTLLVTLLHAARRAGREGHSARIATVFSEKLRGASASSARPPATHRLIVEARRVVESGRRAVGRSGLTAEWALAAFVITALAFVVWRFNQDGYLGQPFYYRADKSLMDLYTPALWANDAGAYVRWHSLYPPLSFVYLKFTSVGRCYALGDLAGRGCDSLARATLVVVYLINIVLVWASYRVSDARTAIPRSIAMCLGLPMLYTLERGNLLIPCFSCFVLGYGDVIRSRILRWLALALSMNFKPYLGLVALPFILTRRWAWVVGTGILTVTVYVATMWIYGSGDPLELITNESRYAVTASKDHFADLYYATSYWPLIRLLQAWPQGLVLASPTVSLAWSWTLTAILRMSQVAAIGCVIVGLFRPGATEVRRLGALVAAVSITAFTTGSAGYAQIFLLFLVLFEPWRGPTRITILVASYLLCVPLDYVFLPVRHDHLYSFLGDRTVTTNFGLSIGQLLRPALLLAVQWGLISLNVADLLSPRAQSALEA